MARKAVRPLRWLDRQLIRPNKLRRPSDRIEGIVVVLLSAAFAVAAVAASCLGAHMYQSQRAAAARLHPAVAVLSQSGPAESGVATQGEAAARWRAPDGQQRAGLLTTSTAPGIWGAPARSRVPVWLTGSGQPATPPPGPLAVLCSAVAIAAGVTVGAGVVLLICYWLCRLMLDRRRLAGWESAWALTGPRWTTRR
jgi:hypothetical protein